MLDIQRVAIPKRMKHLDRDPRGYPIPVNVWRDQDGRPHFTINDEAKRILSLVEETCSVCGQALLPVRWLAGGPLSAFDERGAYLDPPMHRECLRYSMLVCPYLAMPSYAKRIDSRTVTKPQPKERLFIDNTMMPGRPEVFVIVGFVGQRINFTGTGPLDPVYVHPNRPYKRMEFWRHGKQINEPEAMRIISPVLAAWAAQ